MKCGGWRDVRAAPFDDAIFDGLKGDEETGRMCEGCRMSIWLIDGMYPKSI